MTVPSNVTAPSKYVYSRPMYFRDHVDLMWPSISARDRKDFGRMAEVFYDHYPRGARGISQNMLMNAMAAYRGKRMPRLREIKDAKKRQSNTDRIAAVADEVGWTALGAKL